MRAVLALFPLVLCACGNSAISQEISQLATINDKRLDLSNVGGSEWDRLCFLGPYSGNKEAEKTLGFAWNVESRTDIQKSDGINVLVFVKGSEVIAYTKHPRHQDFWRLSGQCFSRGQAVFVKGNDSYVHES